MAVSSQYDLVASGGRDGSILLHTLRSGRYTRTIPPPERGAAALRFLAVTPAGMLVAYYLHSSTLATYTINGKGLHGVGVADRLYSVVVSQSGQYVLGAGEAGRVWVWRVSDLTLVQQLAGSVGADGQPVTLRCLSLTPNEQHLLVGTARGEMLI